jgi:DNA-binding HxlR family transcriptional regulator
MTMMSLPPWLLECVHLVGHAAARDHGALPARGLQLAGEHDLLRIDHLLRKGVVRIGGMVLRRAAPVVEVALFHDLAAQQDGVDAFEDAVEVGLQPRRPRPSDRPTPTPASRGHRWRARRSHRRTICICQYELSHGASPVAVGWNNCSLKCKQWKYLATDAKMQAVFQTHRKFPMATQQKSLCPINLALEVFGDRWSLLIVRDLMFAGKRHFREFLQSEEGISSNILTERLGKLVEYGVLSKTDDPTHKQKAIYSLTPMGIDLLPVVTQIGIWGRKHRPVTRESGAPSAALEKGGAALQKKMQSELRKAHLGGRGTA